MSDIKIHILGSCSGTEPYENRHHTSVALETAKGLYWLDAGECCSYTAYLMGIDLLKTRGIFISHCHMDHIGGLGNLLWNIRKLTVVEKRKTLAEKISVFVPYHESYQAVMDLLAHTEDDFVCNYEHEGCSVQDGLLYQGGADEDEIRVLALHNHHLKHEEGTPWRSFSFQIEVMGRKIFYSGDTEREDLADTVPDDCDLLMIETGHHQIEQICDCLRKYQKLPKKLLFIHHGVKILQNPERARKELKSQCEGDAQITEDRMTLIL